MNVYALSYRFFIKFSKFTVILAILVTVVVLVLKYGFGAFKRPGFEVASQKKINISTKATKSSLKLSLTPSKPTFDISVAQECYIDNGDNPSIKLKIWKKQILAEIQTKKNNQVKYLLLQDGCLKTWQDGQKTGQSVCGFEGVIDTFGEMASSNKLTEGTMRQLIELMAPDLVAKSQSRLSLRDICRETNFNTDDFAVPKDIKFVNKGQQNLLNLILK